MTSGRKSSQLNESAVKACYSTWSRRYYDDYYSGELAYPPVHTNIVRDLLSNSRGSSLLDAGCGPASMLRDLMDLEIDLYGFDLTPEMVDEARVVMASRGLPEQRVWQGSVLDRAAYYKRDDEKHRFDVVICFGVLPHIREVDERIVVTNMFDAVRPGGLVVLEARNALFSLYTLNRYSRDFFREQLIDEATLRSQAGKESAALTKALRELDTHFRLDLPEVRKGYEGEEGYDEVLSRTHNPLTFPELLTDCEFTDVQLYFYHFHALPPILQTTAPELFRRASLDMENPKDWRGYFIASAFIVTARKPA